MAQTTVLLFSDENEVSLDVQNETTSFPPFI